MEASREDILKALEQVIDPELKRNVVELDMVRDVRIEGEEVTVGIALTVAGCPLRASFEEQVAKALSPLGVQRVQLEFDVMTPEERAALTARLRGSVTERTKGIALDRSTRVLAIASGKGGVGKSTLSANLAVAFARLGQRTGILDADVYGHSIPHLLGIHQKPVAVDRMIVPPVRGELKLMSIGFFLDDNQPVMWRGPMLHRALEQFLTDVHWGELDVLVVDMPPGTGDISISLGQLLPRAEVVVVTNLAAAAGVIGAMATIWAITRTFDIGMTGNGAIAALVAITAPSGYVEFWAAPIIGVVAGIIVVLCVIAIDRVLDDPVGALSAHGVAGVWGTLSCGLFTSPRLATLNGIGKPGLVYNGSFHQLGAQGLGIAAAFVSVFCVSYVVFFVIKALYGLRVHPDEERYGLDIVEHGMWGYPEQFMPVPGSEYHPPAPPARRPTPRPVPIGLTGDGGMR